MAYGVTPAGKWRRAAWLLAAERFDHAHAALVVLLGLNGLPVSEACGAYIEDMAFERGHRVLRNVGIGNEPASILEVR